MLSGRKEQMTTAVPSPFDRPRIVVADEDPAVVAFVIDTLRKDGNAVFHAYDGLSAVQLAHSLDVCHLLISNTRVQGLAGVDLIQQLRQHLPDLPIVYLANLERSTVELDAQLPP